MSPIDLEAVVLGVSMQLMPNVAGPQLARLDVSDFTDWRAATVVELLSSMVANRVPTLNPASIVGYALNTGSISGEHRLSQVSKWIADAYSCPIPGIALSYHVDLLIEASYRRAAVEFAHSISQAHVSGSLDILDERISSGYSRLLAHRNRFSRIPSITEVAA